jgi:hypothetical protein
VWPELELLDQPLDVPVLELLLLLADVIFGPGKLVTIIENHLDVIFYTFSCHYMGLIF